MHQRPQRYNLAGSIQISLDGRYYYAWLDSEIVVGEVFRRDGTSFLRRVKSWDIETTVLLRASDKEAEQSDDPDAQPDQSSSS